MKFRHLLITLLFPIGLGAQIQIQRDVRIPKLNTFNPAEIPDAWAEKSQSPHQEMPLPEGIDENLRKRLDAQREQRIRQNRVQLRKRYGAPATPIEKLNPIIEQEFEGQYLSGE